MGAVKPTDSDKEWFGVSVKATDSDKERFGEPVKATEGSSGTWIPFYFCIILFIR